VQLDTVLLVENDRQMQNKLRPLLKKEGYNVITAYDGEGGLNKFRAVNTQLVICELEIPKMGGYEFCKIIREISAIPIIIVTSLNGDLEKVKAFSTGIDDFITKPFSEIEIIMRIKAVLRRSYQPELKASEENVIKCSDLVIDRMARQVKTSRGYVQLTKKEFNTLWLLAIKPNRVFSKEEILYAVWGNEQWDIEKVTVLMSRLRNKIEDNSNSFIKTVWGVGYKFDGTNCGRGNATC